MKTTKTQNKSVHRIRQWLIVLSSGFLLLNQDMNIFKEPIIAHINE